MVNCAWDSFCSNQICTNKVTSAPPAWSSDQHFTLKIQIMSDGDTDNHMYGTLDIVSAWSLFSFSSALLQLAAIKFACMHTPANVRRYHACSSFVNSVCPLADFSCPVSDRKLFKLITVCVIGSIRRSSILVFKVTIYTYINVNSMPDHI